MQLVYGTSEASGGSAQSVSAPVNPVSVTKDTLEKNKGATNLKRNESPATIASALTESPSIPNKEEVEDLILQFKG